MKINQSEVVPRGLSFSLLLAAGYNTTINIPNANADIKSLQFIFCFFSKKTPDNRGFHQLA